MLYLEALHNCIYIHTSLVSKRQDIQHENVYKRSAILICCLDFFLIKKISLRWLPIIGTSAQMLKLLFFSFY